VTEQTEIIDEPAVPEDGAIILGEDGVQHASLVIKRLLPNRRIDKYLRHRFPDFSRAIIQRLIKEKAVQVNGLPTKNSYQLDAGDKIDLILPPPATDEIPPENIPLNVIYEDDCMLVINKQANLIVHPARGNRSGTLVNGLVYYSDTLSQVNGQFRPGIVHRLDRNTTGVMLVAKTDTAHWRLAHQFEHRHVKKTYLAIAQGSFDLDADVIDIPLGRHPRIREKYAAQPVTGKQAVTTYIVEQRFQGYTLLRLLPKTGRTHQLRVHLNITKHPIACDTMYGGKIMTLRQLLNDQPSDENDPLLEGLHMDDPVMDRQALHASELTISHPDSGEEMTFKAELPPDFDRLLSLLGRYRGLE
jgi:23S rRNA pseudouridine1911/1915/1917 synthase